MGVLVAASATSHAFAMMDPEKWTVFLDRNRQAYNRRYGSMPALAPQCESETLEINKEKYRDISNAHDLIAKDLVEANPDILILIGDDQNEIYRDDNIPQFAIYNGGGFVTSSGGAPYISDPDFANVLLSEIVQEGFDVSICGKFPDDCLKSHAFAQVLDRLAPPKTIPILPIFVNGIHVPGPEPRRCYAFGKALRAIIEAKFSDKRVAVIASGGLSHFTAGYPWRSYSGPFGYGQISEDFDKMLIAKMREGKNFDGITAKELVDHGEVEFRSWLVLLGMVGNSPFELLAYHAIYSAIMGIGVARWKV